MVKNIKSTKRSIRFKVFSFYAIIIIVIYVCFMSFITVNFYDNTVTEMNELVENDVRLYSESIDQEILIMDNVAMSAMFSYKTDEFLQKNITANTLETSISNLDEIAFDVTAELASAVSLSYSVHQASIHNNNNIYLTSRSNYYIIGDISALQWYDDTIALNGDKYVTSPYLCSDTSMSIANTTTQYLMSLSRAITDEYGVQKGVVEVRQYASKVFLQLEKLLNSNIYDTILVLDENNKVIFPYWKDSTVDPAYYNTLTSLQDDEPLLYSENNRLHSFFRSRETGYTLIAVSNQNNLLNSFIDKILPYSLMSLVGIVLIVILSYFGSNQLTKPLAKLKNRIERYSVSENDIYSDTQPIKHLESGVAEIDALSNAFDDMNEKLIKSIYELMVEHQQKLQYKMLALQSQMNPHFLHNSLANISALADINETDKISHMCSKMSLMLRYISSGKDGNVSVKEELDFAKNYAEIIKIRFDNNLVCSFNIEPEMYDILLPKLSIQPLIENSAKACMIKSTHGKIDIDGTITDNGWQISVTDNGSGFTQEAYNTIFKRIQDVESANIIPEIELDGMGLLNIYLRLKLMYIDSTVFTISNLNGGGCKIIIGVSNNEK